MKTIFRPNLFMAALACSSVRHTDQRITRLICWHQLGTETLKVRGEHETVDTWVIRKENVLTVLLTNHALPRRPIKTELLTVRLLENLKGAPPTAYVQRIDENHG